MNPRAFLAGLWTLVIFVLCWLPRMYVPGQEERPKAFLLSHLDKLVHAGIFVLFAFLWMRAFNRQRRGLCVFVAGILVAAMTEMGQANRFVNRDANLADGLADTTGVILGLLAFWSADHLLARRRDLKTRSSETP